MDERRLTAEEWGQYLARKDRVLTLDEAQLFVAMRACDYANETRTAVNDMMARITRIEIFLTQLFPNYDQTVRREIERALEEAKKPPKSIMDEVRRALNEANT